MAPVDPLPLRVDLREMDKLRWNTTIGEVFRDVPQNPAWANITLEQLLAHRAGFAHDAGPPNFVRRLHARNTSI